MNPLNPYGGSFFSRFIHQRVFILLFILFGFLSTQAQVTVGFTADSNKINLGDPLKVKLSVKHQSNYQVSLPVFGDTLGKIDILAIKKDTVKVGEEIIESQTLTLGAYNSGIYSIAPIPVLFRQKGDSIIDTAYSNGLEFMVNSIPVDTTKPFKPIKAPIQLPLTWQEILPWVLGGILLLLLAALGYYFWKKRKQKPAAIVERPKPKEPAHIWAANELRKLEGEKLWQKDEEKQYYSRMTEILRLYLEYRFDMLALESTTEEINADLSQYKISPDATARLMGVLKLGDLVKFAKMKPMPDENMSAIKDAYQFVELTKQVEEVKS